MCQDRKVLVQLSPDLPLIPLAAKSNSKAHSYIHKIRPKQFDTHHANHPHLCSTAKAQVTRSKQNKHLEDPSSNPGWLSNLLLDYQLHSDHCKVVLDCLLRLLFPVS